MTRQSTAAAAKEGLKDRSIKIVVEEDQIAMLRKDKIGTVSREQLTTNWTN